MDKTSMSFEQILGHVLNLDPCWELDSFQLLDDSDSLIVNISYKSNTNLECPICHRSNLQSVREEIIQTRFFNFFQFQTHIRSPRIWCQCPEHGEQRIANPWEKSLQQYLNK